MTREEAISLIKSAQLMLINPTTNEPISDLYAALDMAISALEQEPLGNIREEIASHIGGCGFLNDGLDLALEIIDKHIEGR